MKADKAAIVAKGSSPEPLLYSYLDAANKQANGNPGSFVTSIEKAMPAVQKMADDGTIDPETLKAFQGLSKIARTAKFGGWLANMAVPAAAEAIGGPQAGAAAATAAIGLHFKPGYSAPGLMWKLLQSPTTRSILSIASKLPEGSPELELIGRDMSKRMAAMAAVTSSMTRPGVVPAMASQPSTPNPEIVQTEQK
jgi:hypothetical protein